LPVLLPAFDFPLAFKQESFRLAEEKRIWPITLSSRASGDGKFPFVTPKGHRYANEEIQAGKYRDAAAKDRSGNIDRVVDPSGSNPTLATNWSDGSCTGLRQAESGRAPV
jgi:hypothetical protein